MKIWKTVITAGGSSSVYIPGGVPEGYPEKVRDLLEEVYDQGRQDQEDKDKRELQSAVDTINKFLKA